MDVHIGKSHSENKECGICECNTKSLEDLEIHLSGCEIYKCASNDDLECDYKVKTLSEIRNHIKKEHKWGYFKHVKMIKMRLVVRFSLCDFVNEKTPR